MKKYIGFLVVLGIFFTSISGAEAMYKDTKAPTPFIKVISPNGGETIKIGETYKIKWKSNISRKARVDIFLYDASIRCRPGVVGCWSSFGIGSTKNTGSFMWDTSKYMFGSGGPGTVSISEGDDYKIILRVYNVGISDKSDNYFEIVNNDVYLAPVISGVSGPQNLDVGQTGTWSVKAYDPNGGNLSYSVDWGERLDFSLSNALSAYPKTEQSTTFTHRYSRSGNYRVTFTVTNEYGETETTSITVNVTDEFTGYPWYYAFKAI